MYGKVCRGLHFVNTLGNSEWFKMEPKCCAFHFNFSAVSFDGVVLLELQPAKTKIKQH